MTSSSPRLRATSFDSVASQYAAARPGYPPQLLTAVEELAGRPLRGAEVLDVGAGTGISSRQLAEAGARVLAAEPGPHMAAELRAAAPGIPVVRGDGNALPFAAASFDLVVYAQSWHWTDVDRSLPEALRVLRAGGTLALWWNLVDPDAEWAAEQAERLAPALPLYSGRQDSELVRALREAGVRHGTRRVRWTRPVPLEKHLLNLSSHSHFAVLGPAESRRLLEEERRVLLSRFPDEVVPEAYVVELVTATRPA